MKYRPFGNTGMEVSEIGMGCSQLGGTLNHRDSTEAVSLLNLAFESGINFFDTADSYRQGGSERLIGQAFNDKREKVVLATKVGYHFSRASGIISKIKPLLRSVARLHPAMKKAALQARSNVRYQDFSRDYLVAATQGCLQRLQTDYLDLLQLHSPPTSVLKTGEPFEVLDTLKAQGLIRHYGVSCLTVKDAMLCLNYRGISSIQIEINLFQQQAISQFLPLARSSGVAVIARQPFASGALFQALADRHSRSESNSYVENAQKLLEKDDSGALVQAALQFVLELEGVSVVIPGVSKLNHLQQNLDLLTAPPLTQEKLDDLINAISQTT